MIEVHVRCTSEAAKLVTRPFTRKLEEALIETFSVERSGIDIYFRKDEPSTSTSIDLRLSLEVDVEHVTPEQRQNIGNARKRIADQVLPFIPPDTSVATRLKVVEGASAVEAGQAVEVEAG